MDAALKKLVSGRLQAQAAGPHPDPELLAAYSENSLSPLDRHNLLTHLAACADCRDALFLAMPEVDTQPVLRPSYKSPRLAVRWATLAASVIVVGAVLLADRGIFNQHARIEQRSADATSEKVAELKAPSMADQASPADDKVESAPAINRVAKVRPPLKHMTAKPQASMQFDQSGEVHFASAQADSGTDQVSAARVSSEEKAFAKDKKATLPVNWSLSPNGDVQRSLDSGKTWQSLPVAGSPFRAISSVGNDIWVGGSAGALYHSADSGQSWTKVDPVSTDDITHIEFTDLQNGLLNTANGQVWSTSDGGRTWHSK
jgi:Photosynthesis system II assembly factor YCF48/Putative zinc-finger